LIRNSGEIDIYIVHGGNEESPSSGVLMAQQKNTWGMYFFAVIMVVLATLIDLFIYPYSGEIGLSNLVMVYMLAVVVVASRGRVGPSMLASLLSALTYIYMFIPPRYSFDMTDLQYIFTLLTMVITAQVISNLTILKRQQAEISYLGEQRTAALHALTRQLASTRGMDKLLEIAVRYISDVFDSEVQVLMPESNQLKVRASSSTVKTLNPKDQGVAQWVFDLGKVAGLGTDTLPFSDALYVPLHGSQGPVGVMRIRPRQSERLLIPEQLHLLEACANQIALAVEVDRLQEKARETQVAIQTERLRTALFSSVSHELQNPLANIVRLINKLTKSSGRADEDEKKESVNNLYREAERLNRLINNLLQITQLEEGRIKLHKKLHSIEDLFQSSLSRIEKKLHHREVTVQIPEHFPLVPFDKVLMEQVMVNLIENAILYTPPESVIEVSANLEEDNVLLSVADHGPGLMMTDVEKVFEKFYRGQTPKKESGAGLGLSVCQSILKAHGGRIWAENRWNGGAIFYFVLPLHESITE
jgi:two-component system sensor histidine kinase KdpD